MIVSHFACLQSRDPVDLKVWGASLSNRQRELYLVVKAGVEYVASTILLVACAPLLALLAALVKLTSRGPAFYSQVRLGRHGNPFRIHKLRTMTHNCEAESGPVWAQRNDPRITPLGRFLRDTHLDEVPQLWNVLRGEMSLIGPRPERPEIVWRLQWLVPNYTRRMVVRPGLTGLAQVRLPGDRDISSVNRKLRRDLYYVNHVAPLLDVRIALATVLLLIGNGARSVARLLVVSCDAGIAKDFGTESVAANTTTKLIEISAQAMAGSLAA